MSYFPRDTTPTDGSTNVPDSNGVFDALALKAPLASPTFTGVAIIPTVQTGKLRNYDGIVTDITVTQSYGPTGGETLRINDYSITVTLTQGNLVDGDIFYVSVNGGCPSTQLVFTDCFNASTTLTTNKASRTHYMFRKLPLGLQYFSAY